MNKIPSQKRLSQSLMSLCIVFLRGGLTTTIITVSSLCNIYDHLPPSSILHNLLTFVHHSSTSSERR